MILKNIGVSGLNDYLKANGWLNTGEECMAISIPGSGNMNYVIRVHTSQRTFILKQSMPYVEKYPSVAAPRARIKTEYLFYKHISQNKSLQRLMPVAIGLDAEHHILALEDAGQVQDGTKLYDDPASFNEKHIHRLVDYLRGLHTFSKTANPIAGFENKGMKTLNALHIFDFPFRNDNGFDLDQVQPGLEAIAQPYKHNSKLKEKINRLQEIYMDTGSCLLHGDFYPGSWLMDETGVVVIDPEFCFYGNNVFDMAIMVAHLELARCDNAIIENAIKQYALPFDETLLYAFAGVEILRRLIGLAQLPLGNRQLEEKQELMEAASRMI
jgi:5-methylthioribose kinase